MVILNRRVVISKGRVAKRGRVFIPADIGTAEDAVRIHPAPGVPLQQVWWTPLANLPGLAKFNFVRVQRALVSDGHDWNQVFVTIRSTQPEAAKAAIQVYATLAESRDHDGTVGTVALTAADIFKLHTNSGVVTLTLPNAVPALRGAELYFEVRSTGNKLVVQRHAGGANPDVILESEQERISATANALNEKLVISWAGPNRWRVRDNTAGWTFA